MGLNVSHCETVNIDEQFHKFEKIRVQHICTLWMFVTKNFFQESQQQVVKYTSPWKHVQNFSSVENNLEEFLSSFNFSTPWPKSMFLQIFLS